MKLIHNCGQCRPLANGMHDMRTKADITQVYIKLSSCIKFKGTGFKSSPCTVPEWSSLESFNDKLDFGHFCLHVRCESLHKRRYSVNSNKEAPRTRWENLRCVMYFVGTVPCVWRAIRNGKHRPTPIAVSYKWKRNSRNWVRFEF